MFQDSGELDGELLFGDTKPTLTNTESSEEETKIHKTYDPP